VRGLLHERTPFFSIHLPELFKARYKKEYFSNLIRNSNKLVTPLDIHATLMNLIDLEDKASNKRFDRIEQRGISLFEEISSKRNCAQAGIQPHWCACLKRTQVKVDANMVVISKNFVQQHLNQKILGNHLNTCQRLQLDVINRVFLLDTFINSEDIIKPKMSLFDRLSAWRFLQEPPIEIDYKKYLFQITVKPSNAIYEFTVAIEQEYLDAVSSRKNLPFAFEIQIDSISRVNMYGNTSNCIKDSFPDLRKYCYCKF
jgi:hypothetical protein